MVLSEEDRIINSGLYDLLDGDNSRLAEMLSPALLFSGSSGWSSTQGGVRRFFVMVNFLPGAVHEIAEPSVLEFVQNVLEREVATLRFSNETPTDQSWWIAWNNPSTSGRASITIMFKLFFEE